ncbi:hypothetical protein HTT03_11815 [Sulfitobacter sp. S0837]|nr:hypothetical protein [Sulfitobacter maritimus]
MPEIKGAWQRLTNRHAAGLPTTQKRTFGAMDWRFGRRHPCPCMFNSQQPP